MFSIGCSLFSLGGDVETTRERVHEHEHEEATAWVGYRSFAAVPLARQFRLRLKRRSYTCISFVVGRGAVRLSLCPSWHCACAT